MGECIYVFIDNLGMGIVEFYLFLGVYIFRDYIFLGMVMELCKFCYYDEVNLVKCFVCIVLGINS